MTRAAQAVGTGTRRSEAASAEAGAGAPNRPAASVAHSSASHVVAASATWIHTSSAGSSSSVLQAADDALRRRSARTVAVSAPLHLAVAPAPARAATTRATAATPEHASRSARAGATAQSSVSAPRHSRRSISSPVPAPPACGPAAVAAVPTKIVTAPSGSSAAHRPRRQAVAVARGRSPGSQRARQASATAGDEDEHREHVVPHDEAGREVVAHGEAAEHGLRRPRRAAAAAPISARSRRNGRAAEGASRPAADRGEADEARQQAVAELDHGVRLERRQRPCRALRPVGQPRPEPVSAHRRAGEHDQRQEDERDLRDVPVLQGRERAAQAGHGSGRVARLPRGRRPAGVHDTGQGDHAARHHEQGGDEHAVAVRGDARGRAGAAGQRPFAQRGGRARPRARPRRRRTRRRRRRRWPRASRRAPRRCSSRSPRRHGRDRRRPAPRWSAAPRSWPADAETRSGGSTSRA